MRNARHSKVLRNIKPLSALLLERTGADLLPTSPESSCQVPTESSRGLNRLDRNSREMAKARGLAQSDGLAYCIACKRILLSD